ncbi:uncharacterized protein LOC125083819 isoform X2 [Lutra lutra]|uniref:uncharacterized protein LOC125083819 isoform X2 n=1 Tax=Lutra lutra TaxID=9657 RepID=UPI001FD021CE|nr:uncharacterized protein LOC125083819 isoform X2 [Lutra lutra]
MKRPTILNRILDSPDTQPPEEDRIQGSQECAGTGSSVEVLPALEPKPGPAWPAALPQQMTPGPQLSGASGRALAGRLQHEDCHPPLWSPPPQTWCQRLCPLLHRQVPRWVPFSGTPRRKPLGPSRGAGRLAGERSRPGAQTSGDLRPFRLLCPPHLHVSTAPGSVHRHAFLLPKALLRLRADYRLNERLIPHGVCAPTWRLLPISQVPAAPKNPVQWLLPSPVASLSTDACPEPKPNLALQTTFVPNPSSPPCHTPLPCMLFVFLPDTASHTHPWTAPWTESAMKSWPLPPSKSGTKSKSEHWYNHCVGPASQQNIVAGRHCGGAGCSARLSGADGGGPGRSGAGRGAPHADPSPSVLGGWSPL